MATLATLDPDSPIGFFQQEIMFSLVRYEADPHVHKYVPIYKALLEESWEVAKEESMLLYEVYKADALMEKADQYLDEDSDALAHMLAIEYGKKHQINASFYGNLTPSAFRRPFLGPQYASMTVWPGTLAGLPSKGLQELGVKIAEHVKIAGGAITTKSTAEQVHANYRVTGRMKQFADKVNGARKATFGEIGQMVHDQPELKLVSNYAESFYRRASATREPTLAELARKVKTAEAQWLKLKDQYDSRSKLEEEQEALARKATRAQRQSEIKRAQDDLAARQAELEALLAEDKEDSDE